MPTTFEIRDQETHEVVHTVTTDLPKDSSSFDRFEMGMLRKVDLDRFYVAEVEQ